MIMECGAVRQGRGKKPVASDNRSVKNHESLKTNLIFNKPHQAVDSTVGIIDVFIIATYCYFARHDLWPAS